MDSMNKLRIYIADVDSDFTVNVCKALARCGGMEVVGTAADGAFALRQLEYVRPDVLLTDIQLPGIDGLSLIRRSRRLPHPPVVIACTGFYSNLCMEQAAKHGAAFFLYKPIEYERLPGIIRACCAEGSATRRQEADAARHGAVESVRAILMEMGIPAKLTGAQYLVESALRLREDRLLLRNLSCGLYADIARRMNTTAPRIERALRSAIAVGYGGGAMKRYFNYRPTNKEFLEFLLRRIEG